MSVPKNYVLENRTYSLENGEFPKSDLFLDANLFYDFSNKLFSNDSFKLMSDWDNHFDSRNEKQIDPLRKDSNILLKFTKELNKYSNVYVTSEVGEQIGSIKKKLVSFKEKAIASRFRDYVNQMMRSQVSNKQINVSKNHSFTNQYSKSLDLMLKFSNNIYKPSKKYRVIEDFFKVASKYVPIFKDDSRTPTKKRTLDNGELADLEFVSCAFDNFLVRGELSDLVSGDGDVSRMVKFGLNSLYASSGMIKNKLNKDRLFCSLNICKSKYGTKTNNLKLISVFDNTFDERDFSKDSIAYFKKINSGIMRYGELSLAITNLMKGLEFI